MFMCSMFLCDQLIIVGLRSPCNCTRAEQQLLTEHESYEDYYNSGEQYNIYIYIGIHELHCHLHLPIQCSTEAYGMLDACAHCG